MEYLAIYLIGIPVSVLLFGWFDGLETKRTGRPLVEACDVVGMALFWPIVWPLLIAHNIGKYLLVPCIIFLFHIAEKIANALAAIARFGQNRSSGSND